MDCLRKYIKFKSLITVILTLACTSLVWATDAGEYEVKAAFTLNFARFTEFGEKNDSEFVFCVAGNNKVNNAFEILSNKRVHGRDIKINYVSAVTDADRCSVLFIQEKNNNKNTLLAYANDKAILTVGDDKDFIEEGGIIRLIRKGDRMQFDIDQTKAIKRKLEISSRLLSLATHVVRSE